MQKISVAICTYNGEKYLKDQLDSIVNQTYKNIEIIITDDASTDNTIKIIKEFQKKYKFIKLYENKKNIGYVKNFERAINLSTGDYIALSDQDDYWMQNKLELLLNEIEKRDDSLLVYSDSMIVDENLKELNRTLSDNYPPYGNNNLYLLYNNSVAGHAMMFKSELKDKILPFPENIGLHDIWITYVATSFCRILFVKKSLVKYRQHSFNVTDILKKKLHKSYSLKIAEKDENYSVLVKKFTNYVNFLERNIPEHGNLNLIRKLLHEHEKYNSYFINLKLFWLIVINRDKLFFRKKDMNIIKILKMSIGIKLYRIMPFI